MCAKLGEHGLFFADRLGMAQAPSLLSQRPENPSLSYTALASRMCTLVTKLQSFISRHFGTLLSTIGCETSSLALVDKVDPLSTDVQLSALPETESEPAQPTRTPSPCFINAVYDELTERPREALMEAQRVVIEKYCILSLHGVLRSSTSDKPSIICDEPNSHPIQDPNGALFLALLVVRKNRPFGECWMDLPRSNRIRMNYRIELAALLAVCHKLCTSLSAMKLHHFLQYLYTQFLYPFEMPDFANHSERICDEFCRRQVLFLNEDLHALLVDNPQTIAEVIIGELFDMGKLSMETAKVFRGSTFFVLGSCMMNRKEDVLEFMSGKYGDRAIAQACVLVLIILLTTRGILLTDSSGSEDRQAESSDADRAERLSIPVVDDKLYFIAGVLLRNCTKSHSNQLRIGPYRSQVHPMECPHPVQLLLHPLNLKTALARLHAHRPSKCFRK